MRRKMKRDKPVGRDTKRTLAQPLKGLSKNELKLTAILYARLGAGEHLRESGKLPDQIGGMWNVIPMRIIIEERGTDPVLTPDEQSILDAIISEGRLPGGAIRLVKDAPTQKKSTRKTKVGS